MTSLCGNFCLCLVRLVSAHEPDHVKFTYGMHKELLETEAKEATENWVFGEQPTEKLVQWCQDQWRRKKPCLPENGIAFSVNEP